MRKFLLIAAMLAVYSVLFAQVNRANRLFEYRPAPGQFINNPNIGTPEAAEKILFTDNNLVSLGAWGGYIVLGFERPVKNHPDNPYGIDFTIFGNAFSGSSEPGIVWVMKDENGNGLPDDTWYQIAGSSYFHPKTVHGYQVTWFRQADGSAIWKDNLGKTGTLLKNEFHLQAYYPDPKFFNDYPSDSVSFSGSLLGHSSLKMNGQIVLPSLAFGYADNQPVIRGVSPSIPDNPYTPNVREGAGGDPIDISWAVDSRGNYVDLDEIHFVKIVTGALSELGILGEISTEVGSVVATEPTGTKGRDRLMVVHPHAPSILVGDSLNLYDDFFINGRRQERPFVFENSDGTKAGISLQGTIKAIDGGIIRVSVYPEGFPDEIAHTELAIRKPERIGLNGFENKILAGKTLSIDPVLIDQFGENIPVYNWIIESENTDIISITENNKSYTLNALRPGTGSFMVYPLQYPNLRMNIQVEVLPSVEKIRVYVTAKTMHENLFASRWIEVGPFSINQAVQNRKGDYSAPGFVSLAQVVMSMLQQSGVNFWFRDDEAGGMKLYLYSVETDGFFTYGWGGKTEPAAFARAWIVKHNSKHHFTNLSAIRVNHGDTIILYHVDNILEKWNLTYFTASIDSGNIGDIIETINWKTECYRNESGVVTESDNTPVVNQPLFLNSALQPIAFSDNHGKSAFTIEQSPPFIIRSDNNAVFIAPKLVTNVNTLITPAVSVFPNPSDDVIYLNGLKGLATVRIFGVGGNCVAVHQRVITGTAISIGYLSSGTYVLAAEDDNNVHRIKFIKR